MVTAAIILFAIAALGGATLAAMRFANRPLPFALAIAHGVLAAAGLVLLIIALVNWAAVATIAKVALVLFIIAALGGAILFSFHLRSKPLPIFLVVVHGAIAVIAFVLLIYPQMT